MSDRLMGCVGLLLSGLYVWAAFLIPESFMADVIGPSTFPVIIGAVMAIASIIFILKPDAEPLWPTLGRMLDIGFALVVMALYAWLLADLGFVLTTSVATAYLTWRLGTRPAMSIVVGIATAFALYAVFHLVLGLSLATGTLGI